MPGLPHAGVLVQTRASLISAGTERMLVEFGKAGLIGKARAQPEKVKQVLDKIRTDGLLPTLETVFNRLDEPLPLGYCNAGMVIEAGPGSGFQVNDRVASNGPHAELVAVPHNLCAKIPEGVTDEQAAFTVLASIGLQGIRLAQPTLGERFVVFGLGRYDEKYEQGGQDYPVGFVRWTAQRNFEAVLAMLATGRLCVDRLITHRFPIDHLRRNRRRVGGRFLRGGPCTDHAGCRC